MERWHTIYPGVSETGQKIWVVGPAHEIVEDAMDEIEDKHNGDYNTRVLQVRSGDLGDERWTETDSDQARFW